MRITGVIRPAAVSTPLLNYYIARPDPRFLFVVLASRFSLKWSLQLIDG
jgi:hypothetical protein